jgi:hypothetical protein
LIAIAAFAVVLEQVRINAQSDVRPRVTMSTPSEINAPELVRLDVIARQRHALMPAEQRQQNRHAIVRRLAGE